MHEAELNTHEEVLGELADEGIDYWPLVWSCWGRPHVDASAAIGIAQRQGVAHLSNGNGSCRPQQPTQEDPPLLRRCAPFERD